MTLSQLLVWFAHRRGPYTNTNVIRRELGDVGHLLEHLVSLKLLSYNNGAYRLVYQSRYWGSRDIETLEILEREKMKCKHCDLQVIRQYFPMMPGQTKPSGVYWVHDLGNGALTVYGIRGDGHLAEPRVEESLADVIGTDDCDGDAFCGCGRVYPHRASTKRIRRQQQERESSFPLWIYIHAWERHESTTVELRDYLRAKWRSAGYATAVGR